jgi:hypothetical protein
MLEHNIFLWLIMFNIRIFFLKVYETMYLRRWVPALGNMYCLLVKRKDKALSMNVMKANRGLEV